MREGNNVVNLIVGIIVVICCNLNNDQYWVNAEDPYRYFTFEVTYGTLAPLGVKQKVSISSLAFFALIVFFFSIQREKLDSNF